MTLQLIIYLLGILMAVAAYFWGFFIGEEQTSKKVREASLNVGYKQGYTKGVNIGYARGISYQEVQFDILRREMTTRLMDRDRIITELRKENEIYKNLLKEVDDAEVQFERPIHDTNQ